ncbi:peptidase M6 [Nonomuraea jiangxiensis]|uniref:M6 family metalloprotease domain-containing protein n=1 Tax=Nonomuraea jiangxiensis TaxID=633440 RepID=A0A1G9N1L7_9ACTN|nr:peptidase M6 [Nonomuraea jiangxiensis]SDL80151.1 M6 family metalloprotease domain-containing protein [Nonomuraea jiangxiensis]
MACTTATGATAEPAGRASGTALADPLFQPIDPQVWQDQQDMTWADYRAVPGADWANPARQPTVQKLRIAVLAVDFPDQPFVITRPKGSDPFGNPQVDPVRRQDVARFYADFWGKPSALNHGHTVNEYWMEQTSGRIGVEFVPFGPYQAPRPLYEYGINDIGQEGAGCPSGHTCNGRLEADVDGQWLRQVGQAETQKYDMVLRVYAGYDETSVWQEFGEMKFQNKEDIPDEWGPPDPALPNWVRGRYTEWTSWKAGAMLWGNAGIRQGESSGTITHEISHRFDIGDNNNNPYRQPYRRVGTGPFDLMDRGSFNGPGGPHNRWQVPATQGASMPAGQTLRAKLKLNFIGANQVLNLSGTALRSGGVAVFEVKARSALPTTGELQGVLLDLGQDRTPACNINTNPLCSGPGFTNYSLEVVQRIGTDSFTPDNGVMLTKNKPFSNENDSCGYLCFSWMIDANPQDINMVDYRKPNGTAVMRSIGDYRQLNDGLFHAGTDSGSKYEYVDQANRLHFYVIGKRTNQRGDLYYLMAARSLDGAGPSTRGVTLSAGTLSGTTCRFDLSNTGQYRASGQPAAVAAYQRSDVYRLSAVVSGTGWRAGLPNALATAAFGQSVAVNVATAADAGAATTGTVTLTAKSESDPTKVTTASCALRR